MEETRSLDEAVEHIFNTYIFESKIGKAKYNTYYGARYRYYKAGRLTTGIIKYLNDFGYSIDLKSIRVVKSKRKNNEKNI